MHIYSGSCFAGTKLYSDNLKITFIDVGQGTVPWLKPLAGDNAY